MKGPYHKIKSFIPTDVEKVVNLHFSRRLRWHAVLRLASVRPALFQP
jgi:hypothetical protein